MIRIAFLLVAGLLIGCAGFSATRPYERVVTGPSAKLTITKTVRLADVAPNPGGARFLLDILEPDSQCKFTYVGSVDLDPKDDPKAGSLTTVLPAGRAYFRVFIEHPSVIENVSFVLAEGREYSIEYVYLGPGGYDKLRYELNYLMKDASGQWTPVDADFWAVCRREKGLPSE